MKVETFWVCLLDCWVFVYKHGILFLEDLWGKGVKDDQADSCNNLVKRLTASSKVYGSFKLTFRLVWFSRVDLNLSQSIRPSVRLGCYNWFSGVVSTVNKTEEWSEKRK